ncbi:MAG: LysM peptidoglycan-binding domain-containing protein [Myxococcales bacterium FL481]|nr:MAG: LysM peptidoglycan-binding domain-containing protein [Myxococcales bacterium FL481]
MFVSVRIVILALGLSLPSTTVAGASEATDARGVVAAAPKVASLAVPPPRRHPSPFAPLPWARSDSPPPPGSRSQGPPRGPRETGQSVAPPDNSPDRVERDPPARSPAPKAPRERPTSSPDAAKSDGKTRGADAGRSNPRSKPHAPTSGRGGTPTGSESGQPPLGVATTPKAGRSTPRRSNRGVAGSPSAAGGTTRSGGKSTARRGGKSTARPGGKSTARRSGKSKARRSSTPRGPASVASRDQLPRDLSRSRAPNDKRCHYQSPLHEHAVLPGEHLGLIAGRYGVNRREVVALNADIKDPNRIRPGQKIKVCPSIAPRELRAVTYTVASGDTLSSIAAAHDLTLRELMGFQAGKITNPNQIRAGQELQLWVQGAVVADFLPRKRRGGSSRGKLRSGQRLAAASHYHLRRPHRAYGTPRTVALLTEVFGRYRKLSRGGPRLVVGDLSKKGGGPLKGHLSHQRGTDVDIGLVLKGPQLRVDRFVTGTRRNLDVARTWLLVHEFLKTGEVRYVFLDYSLQKLLYEHARKQGVPESRLDEYFQYPRSIRRAHGIVRHWRGHKDHIHVRFRE